MGLDHPRCADGMMNNAVRDAQKCFFSLLRSLLAPGHDLHTTCTDEDGRYYSRE